MYFSVIIPTFNRCDMLKACIDSVRLQDFPEEEFEIIVVDNGSKDVTAQVVESLNRLPGKSIRYIYEGRPGAHHARHAGTKAAKGSILAFIDDDVMVTASWLRNLKKAYNEMDADCAGGKILIRWDETPPPWIIPYEKSLGRLDYGPQMRLVAPNEYIASGNLSIKKSSLYEVGGFNPDQVGDYLVGDGEIGLVRKMQDRGWKIAWAPDALVWHCQTVAKNATEKDISRRYYNNGIGSAYANAKKNGVNKIHLIMEIVRDCVGYLKMYLKNYVKFILNKEIEKPDFRRCKFERALLKGRMKYNWRLIFDTKLKEFIKREDWLNE